MFNMLADTMNYGIGLVQDGKKEWIKQFVKDEKVATSMNFFVDSQTEFAKQIVKMNHDMGVAVSKEVEKLPEYFSIYTKKAA